MLDLTGPSRYHLGRYAADAFYHQGELVVIGLDWGGVTRQRLDAPEQELKHLNDSIQQFPWGNDRSLAPFGVAVTPNREVLAAYGDFALDNDRYEPRLDLSAVRLYSTTNGRLLAELPQLSVSAITFSGDSQRLAIAVGKNVRIHRVPGGQFEADVELGQPATGIMLSEDGQMLGAVAADGTLNLWSLADAREVLRVEAVGHIPDLVLSDDEQYLAKYTKYESRDPVSIWSVADGIRRASFDPDGTVLESHFGPRELAVISTIDPDFLNKGSILELVDVRTGKTTLRFPTAEVLSGIAFDKRDTVLAVGTHSGKVFLWRKTRGIWSGPSMESVAAGAISALEISSDARVIAAGSGLILGANGVAHDDRLRVCALTPTGVWMRPCYLETAINGGVMDLAFNHDGSHLAVASGKSKAYVYDTVAGLLLHTLAHPLDSIQALRFADGDRLLITASSVIRSNSYAVAEAIDLWRLADGRHLDHRGYEPAHPTAGWNVQAPVLYRTAISNHGTISAIVFRNVGERESSGKAPTFPDVVLWRVDRDRFSETYRRAAFQTEHVIYMVVVAGRTKIATIDPATGTAHLYDADSQRLFRIACTAVGNQAGACTDRLTIMDVLQREAARGPRTAVKTIWLPAAATIFATLLRHTTAILVAAALVFAVVMIIGRRQPISRVRMAAIACLAIAFALVAFFVQSPYRESAVRTPVIVGAAIHVPQAAQIDIAPPVLPPVLSKVAQEDIRRRVFYHLHRTVSPFNRTPGENPYARKEVLAGLEKKFGIQFGKRPIPNSIKALENLVVELKMTQDSQPVVTQQRP